MVLRLCKTCKHAYRYHKVFAICGPDGKEIGEKKPHSICIVGETIGMPVMCNCDYDHSSGLEMIKK
jgi:hypothetical protein